MSEAPGPGWWLVVVTRWVRCGTVAVDPSTGTIVTCPCMPVDKLMAMEYPGQPFEKQDVVTG